MDEFDLTWHLPHFFIWLHFYQLYSWTVKEPYTPCLICDIYLLSIYSLKALQPQQYTKCSRTQWGLRRVECMQTLPIPQRWGWEVVSYRPPTHSSWKALVFQIIKVLACFNAIFHETRLLFSDTNVWYYVILYWIWDYNLELTWSLTMYRLRLSYQKEILWPHNNRC